MEQRLIDEHGCHEYYYGGFFPWCDALYVSDKWVLDEIEFGERVMWALYDDFFELRLK